jgi:hypothetical protein
MRTEKFLTCCVMNDASFTRNVQKRTKKRSLKRGVSQHFLFPAHVMVLSSSHLSPCTFTNSSARVGNCLSIWGTNRCSHRLRRIARNRGQYTIRDIKMGIKIRVIRDIKISQLPRIAHNQEPCTIRQWGTTREITAWGLLLLLTVLLSALLPLFSPRYPHHSQIPIAPV